MFGQLKLKLDKKVRKLSKLNILLISKHYEISALSSFPKLKVTHTNTYTSRSVLNERVCTQNEDKNASEDNNEHTMNSYDRFDRRHTDTHK